MHDSGTNLPGHLSPAADPANELRAAALETHALARILMQAGKRDLARRLERCGVDVGPLGFRVMRLLEGQTITLAELSRKLWSGAAGLVPVIDALEARGFVDRGRDPKDRRRTPLTLTPSGREVLARVPAVDDEDCLVRSLAALGIEETRELLTLLRGLVSNVTGDEAAVTEFAARYAAPGGAPTAPSAETRNV